MGLNAYLQAVACKGRKAEATGTDTALTLDGKPGKRIAILAYSFTGNVSSPTTYIQSSIENTAGTAATGASQMTVTTMTGTIASGDNIAYVTNNGKYNYAIASAGCTSSLIGLTAAVASAITAGAVYWLGPYNGSGSFAVALTAGFVATTGSSDVGRFFGNTKGSPMRFFIPSATSQQTSVDYLTVGYINV